MSGRFDDVDQILRGGEGPVFAGAVAGCWRGHDEAWLGATGRTAFPDAGAVDAPVGPDTVFDVASLTKPLATVPVILSLCAQGRLGLDAPIGAFLPFLRGTSWAAATPVHLLSHVSGLPA